MSKYSIDMFRIWNFSNKIFFDYGHSTDFKGQPGFHSTFSQPMSPTMVAKTIQKLNESWKLTQIVLLTKNASTPSIKYTGDNVLVKGYFKQQMMQNRGDNWILRRHDQTLY